MHAHNMVGVDRIVGYCRGGRWFYIFVYYGKSKGRKTTTMGCAVAQKPVSFSGTLLYIYTHTQELLFTWV